MPRPRRALPCLAGGLHEKQHLAPELLLEKQLQVSIASQQPQLPVRSPGAGFANKTQKIVPTGELAS
jgi:hypothetical protein